MRSSRTTPSSIDSYSFRCPVCHVSLLIVPDFGNTVQRICPKCSLEITTNTTKDQENQHAR